MAASASVSKQTVYKQFTSKEELFVAVAKLMTDEASERVEEGMRDPSDASDLRGELTRFAERQLSIVLTPHLLQLRRLAIAEAHRFPELGRAVYEGGAGRAIARLSSAFDRWSRLGLLDASDAAAAASQFNWLVMAEPINRAMFLGDEAAPRAQEIRVHVRKAVATFLRAFAATDNGAAERHPE